jgi:protein SCO1/2
MNRTLTLAAMLIVAGCAKDDRPPASDPGIFSGAVMMPARAKPDFTFTRIDGQPYEFRRETAGKLTYLFFGYTHCPDVCPLHMANLGAVYKKLPYSDQQKIRVIFVTTDPERDTPERLRTWLANFSPDFVGVAGPMEQINPLQQSMGMPPAVIETAPEGSKAGEYGVAHGAALLTFTPDDSLRVLYPFGTRQQDLAKDIPTLLKFTGR